MKTSTTTAATADSALGRTALAQTLGLRIGLALVGIGVLTLSAWLSVPFYPVPLTMQTLAVLLIGGLMGPVLGASTVAGYVAIGVMGAPVFHNGLGGAAVLAGPTGGYLVGFIPAAFLMGLAVRWARADRDDRATGGFSLREWASVIAGAVVATIVIYAFGVPWLAAFAHMNLGHAAAVGAKPFILGDLLKAAVAIGAVRLGGRVLSRRGLLPY